jgi:uncharacterized protein YjdB
MATAAQRAEARTLIERGLAEAEAGAKVLNEAWELLGKPKFTQLHNRPSENLHDVRAHTQRLDAYARSDIYHEEASS